MFVYVFDYSSVYKYKVEYKYQKDKNVCFVSVCFQFVFMWQCDQVFFFFEYREGCMIVCYIVIVFIGFVLYFILGKIVV